MKHHFIGNLEVFYVLHKYLCKKKLWKLRSRLISIHVVKTGLTFSSTTEKGIHSVDLCSTSRACGRKVHKISSSTRYFAFTWWCPEIKMRLYELWMPEGIFAVGISNFSKFLSSCSINIFTRDLFYRVKTLLPRFIRLLWFNRIKLRPWMKFR